MTFKKTAFLLHRILGLAAGIIVTISFLPAAFFVWEKELTDWYYSGYVFQEVQQHTLPMSTLWENAQKALPANHFIESVEVPKDPERAWMFTALKRSANPGLTFFSQYEYWEKVYVNPYTGAVKGTVDMELNWIHLLRFMHQQLLLQYDIGHWIVGVATLIMFVLILSGLVLWWPRNKAAIKQRFRIKFRAKRQRVNYDIHNVGGFYTHILILILAITGLVWTFDWWERGIYAAFGYHPQKKEKTSLPPVTANVKSDKPIDLMFQHLITRRDTWHHISIFGKKEGTTPVTGVVRFDSSSGWDTWDSYSFHPVNGTLMDSMKFENKPVGVKWRSSNYAIHVGSIYGLPTKILACLAALFCSSLPVTGFLIWYNRKWGKRRKKKQMPEITRSYAVPTGL
jgi:uncharacterized iron-regulated membrane protein